MQQIHWIWKEFNQLSVDELYQLMQFRQQQSVGLTGPQDLDADGRDQLAWHLFGYWPHDGPHDGMIACARLCLPDEANGFVTVDRLLCEPKASFSDSLVSEVLRFSRECFHLPLFFEVFDEQVPWLKPRGFSIVVDRAARRHGAVYMKAHQPAISPEKDSEVVSGHRD